MHKVFCVTFSCIVLINLTLGLFQHLIVQKENKNYNLEKKLDLIESSLKGCVCENDTEEFQCRPGWVQFKGKCWSQVNLPVNWSSAEEVCREYGGELVSIDNEEENTFVATSLSQNVTQIEKYHQCFLKHPSAFFSEDFRILISLDNCKCFCKNMQSDCLAFIYYLDIGECGIISTTSQGNLSREPKEKFEFYNKTSCLQKSLRNISTPCYYDMVFLVDGSSSIGLLQFLKVKNFLKDFTDTTTIGRDKSRFGMMQFSHEQWMEFNLTSYNSNDALKKAIDRVPYREGGTLIGQAINYTINNQILNDTQENKHVMIITDGESQDDPLPSAKLLENTGTTIITIGITKYVSVLQLANITDNENLLFFVENFNMLNKNLASLIHNRICNKSNDGAWIGLVFDNITQRYRWYDRSATKFFNWKNKKQIVGHQCVVLHDNQKGTWTETSCDAEKKFLCKYTPKKYFH